MYRIEITEDERFALILALSTKIDFITRPGISFHSEQYAGYLNLMRRLLEVPKLPEGQADAQTPRPAGGIPVAAVKRAPGAGQPTGHNPPPAPERDKKEEMLGELTITPVKVDQLPDGASMVVHYRIRTGNQTRMTKMHCWDPAQFGALLETVGQPTTFLTKATKTGFVNIIGVKKA